MHNPIISATLARVLAAERAEAGERRRMSGRPVHPPATRAARFRLVAGVMRRVQGGRA